MMGYKAYILTMKGKKSANEDCLRVDQSKGVYILADGFSGDHPKSAKAAVECIYARFRPKNNIPKPKEIPAILQETNEWMMRAAEMEGEKMRCTLDLGLAVGQEICFWHIGDGRIYAVPREGKVQQLSEDHNLAREEILRFGEDPVHGKFIMDTSAIPKGPTQYLGKEGEVPIQEIGPLPISSYRRLAMMTDGLPDIMIDSKLEGLLSRKAPKDAIRSMAEAYRSGGSVHEYITHSPRVLEWLIDGSLISYISDKTEQDALERLRGEAGRLRSDHERMKLVQSSMADPAVFGTYLRKGKEYLSGRDNWSLIILEEGGKNGR